MLITSYVTHQFLFSSSSGFFADDTNTHEHTALKQYLLHQQSCLHADVIAVLYYAVLLKALVDAFKNRR